MPDGAAFNRIRVALLLVAAGSMFGCGQNTPVSPSISGASASVVALSISPPSVALTAGQTVQFSAPGIASVVWSVNDVDGGGPSTGTVTPQGLYTAPGVPTSQVVAVKVRSALNPAQSVSATVTLLMPGTVSATNHPQVAQYSFTSPRNASMMVEFGTDTSYGLTTWSQSTSASGGQVNILVAGMRAFTTYHMRAVVQFPDGVQFTDADQVFTTGGLPAARVPWIDVTHPTPGATSAGGVEVLDLIPGTNSAVTPAGVPLVNQVQAAVADMDGNLLWYYDFDNLNSQRLPFPIKPLPDGNVLINIGAVFAGNTTPNDVLEVDLAGKTVWHFSLDDLNKWLIAAGYLPTLGVHHDVLQLPNGHLILIVAYIQDYTNLPGYPGTTHVQADALVDLDQSRKPVWVWRTTDHLDVNRHPMAFPDWTHSNAVLYSPDDGDLVLSMRHQNWIIKIDYQNGHGSGNIVWRLGPGGDFALEGGTDPIDWFYAQHGPSFVSSASSGAFQMAVYDNGNDRAVDSSGTLCGSPGVAACYSRPVELHVDEGAKTAEIIWYDTLPYFSFFGGGIQALGNTDFEFDSAAQSGNPRLAEIQEVTNSFSPQAVWQMDVHDQFAYRAFRIPSLYPGVQW